MKWQVQARSQVGNIRLFINLDLDLPLLKHPEEGRKERLELVAVDGLIAVDVEQVEDVLDIVRRGLLAAHQINDRLHHPRELSFTETVVLVVVELAEDLLQQHGDVLLAEIAWGGVHPHSLMFMFISNKIRVERQSARYWAGEQDSRAIGENLVLLIDNCLKNDRNNLY